MTEKSDILWVIMASTLVMSMQVGFCMVESGLVRSKNTINVAIKNLLDFTIASITFWMIGFGFLFGSSAGGWIGTDEFFYHPESSRQAAAFFIFQVMFCATSATIVSGAVAERMSFRGYLWLTLCASTLIYPIIGHWAWNQNGWLYQMGFVDFAGSGVVHMVGGGMALVAIQIIGPRMGRYGHERSMASSHSMGTATFGVLILFVAWMGFNGGSTLKFDAQVPHIFLTTILAGSAGALGGLFTSYWKTRIANLHATLNGTLAGLVAITANCHAVSPAAALFIGFVGGIICYFTVLLLEKLQLDDVVGASAAHFTPGWWGLLCVALFGDPDKLATGLDFWPQLGVQALGGLAIFTGTGLLSWIVFQIVNHWLQPLRVDAESERVGLNVAEHGATTEIIDLLQEMGRHRHEGDFTRRVQAEPFTEVGQIAGEYNLVIDKVVAEMDIREQIAVHLREEREHAESTKRQVLSSIEYAQRIQQALLTPPSRLASLFPQHFLLHRPRDIVSGDFFWCHQQGQVTFVAVADCTGHGVPGAFMSIVGHSCLQQIVEQQGILEPSEILETLDRMIRTALNQVPGSKNQDGLELALCRISPRSIHFAGSRRPIFWAMPSPPPNRTVVGEIKGNRRPIGGGWRERRITAPFEQHEIPIPSSLSLYLCTDGFTDQPNHLRQPFDTSQLRALLEEVAHLPMALQTDFIAKSFDKHRGGAALRDDVMLLGIHCHR